MNDYNKLAKALISALTKSTNSQIAANKVGLMNTNATINNQANASGTLYSTAPSFKQEQAEASMVQENAKLNTSLLSNKLSSQSSILDTRYKIDAMNRAAKQLDKVKFYL